MGVSRATVPYQRNTDSIVQVNLDVSLWNETLILRQQVSLEPGIAVLRRLRFRVMPIPITEGSTTLICAFRTAAQAQHNTHAYFGASVCYGLL